MSWYEGFNNFALFVLADVPRETVDKILRDAFEGSWTINLVTSSFNAAPKKGDFNKMGLGTRPPIDSSFKSDLIGRKIEDVADLVKTMPENLALARHHFVIIDRGAEQEGTVVACKIGDYECKGNKLSWIRWPAKLASLHLSGMDYGFWESKVGNGPFPDIKY